MDQFKWGGRFNGLDKVAGMPVSGRVFGQFDGTCQADLQSMLSAVILNGFNSFVCELPTSLAEAISNLEDLSRRLTEHLAADLNQHGASGQVTIAMVKPE